MANQTITTNTNFDTLTGLLAGETVTINGGATLVINSDPQLNRVLAGTVTVNDGIFFVDGTTVRELNFSSASSLPAIGDTLTAGSVTGQVIGVAGTTASGTIRLRSLNGAISNGAALSFTGGKTATAASADRVGWLQVLVAEYKAISATRLGTIRFRGQWYGLGVSNGTASQTFQHYCNTAIPCIWVETGVDTGIYKKYLNAGIRFPAEVGVGERGDFFGMTNGNATITFGDGTNGNIPPNGARIRVPNITMGVATTAAPTTPTLPANTFFWTAIGGSGASVVDIDLVELSGVAINATGLYSATIKNTGLSVFLGLTNPITLISLQDVGIGLLGSITTQNAVSVALNNATVDFDDVFLSVHPGNVPCDCANTENASFKNCIFHAFTRTSTGDNVFRSIANRNIYFENCSFIGGQSRFNTTVGITFKNIRHSDRSGNIASSSAIAANGFLFESSTRDVKIDGFTPIDNAALPYNGVFRFNNIVNITIRNIGTNASPINLASMAESVITLQGSLNFNVDIARVYAINTRTNIINQFGNANGLKTRNIGGGGNNTSLMVAADANALSARSSGLSAGGFGSHFYSIFTSDTAGAVAVTGSEKTAKAESQAAYEITAGTPRFNGSGSVLLRSLGDQIIWTTPFILGHTGFTNTAFTFSGTNQSNHSYEYRLDTGSGFAGAWKTLSGANLSAEAISPTTGFRLQIRITCITANASNAISTILIPTITTATDQLTLYPIGVSVPIKIFQCPIGATVAIYRISDDVELFKGFANSQGEINTTYTYESVDVPVRVAVRLAGYVPREEEVPITSSGLSLPMRLEIDLTDNL